MDFNSPAFNALTPTEGVLGALPRNEQDIIYSSVTPDMKSLFGSSSGRILDPSQTINGTINSILFGNSQLNEVKTNITLPSARFVKESPGNVSDYVREFQTGITNFPYLQIFVVVTNNTRLIGSDKIDPTTTKNVGLLIEGRKVIDEINKSVGDQADKISSGINSWIDSGVNSISQLINTNSFGGTIINLGKINATGTLAKGFDYIEKGNAFQDEPKSSSGFFSSIGSAAKADLTRQESRLLNSFALPMPTELTVGGSLKWNAVNAGSLRGLALDTESQAAIGAQLSDNSNFTSELVGKIIGRVALNVGSKVFGGDSDMTDKQFVDKATGTLANPRPTQIFEGTDVRTFKFSWLLSPRNVREAKGALELIEKLRYYAHSEFADSTKTFMRFPSEFDLEFRLPSGALNSNIPQMKRCIMNSIDVIYNDGNGRWTSFIPTNTSDEGIPTHIKLSLTFSEVGIITKEDITAGY